MRFYIATSILILFVLVAFPQGVLGAPITKFGTVQSGSIGIGNGYYDNELGFTNVSINRNIYIITESDVLYIIEPLGYPFGLSGAVQLVAKGAATGDLKYGFVASDGYLYFTDGQGIKRKKTRSDNTLVYANDTAIGSNVLLLYSGTISKLFEFEGQIYFFDGTNLKSFSYPDYTPITIMSGVTQGQDFAIATVGGEFTVFVSYSTSLVNASTAYGRFILYSSTASTKNTIRYDQYGIAGACGGCSQQFARSSLFITSNYIYTNFYSEYSDGVSHRVTEGEKVLYRSNYSIYSSDGYTAIHPNWRSNAYNIGGYSEFAMYAKTTTTYDIFSFAEIGVLNIATVPADITYDIAEVSSYYPTYYNNSKFMILESIQIQSTSNLLLWISIDDTYLWQVDLIDPNNTAVLTYTTGACNGILSCRVINTITFNPPINGWAQGNWTAKLYELNTITGAKALIATSSKFAVSNQSNPGGSIGGNAPISQPNSPVSTTEITNILTSNSFWGLILVAGIMISVGLIAGKNNSNPVMPMLMAGFLALAVVTLMNWLPAWILFSTILIVMAGFAWKLAQNQNTGS